MMTDRLAITRMDSVTDLRGDRQTVGTGRVTDRLVTRQTDMLKDGQVVRQMYRRSGGGKGKVGLQSYIFTSEGRGASRLV